ncbi:methionine sulfoxide reductase [Raphidocelis subcapitata]|uniref:peptide-methionine (S)-S-oxide reductase n=1 Tax=Raphidocelis subcapitata TaxID=307507 RepID=A0A2V0NY76_9CHLO|nr:methionine sulfoxide reductase [Raphidocelis subcapitata]|eukprot:GBF90530.1 methionine sulfoxide reductase [Raphidocelis subcapitata]
MRVACTLRTAASTALAPARAALPRPLAAAPAHRAAPTARAVPRTAPPAPFAFAPGAATRLPGLAPRRARSVATAAGESGSAMATAFLGTGCFWCTEACYEQLKGVSKVASGYAGGSVPNPTYEQVCGKKTGHIECIRVDFDPAVVSYKELLEVFFTIHDPTTPDRQGNDVGPQYASAIFYTDEEQLATARQVIEEVTTAKMWPAPIVTKLLPLATDGAARFWPAEGYHQGYYQANPRQGYCMFVVEPKVAKFRAKWAAKLIK